MGIVNIVKTVKQVHKESIVFVKIGKFFHVYGKDSFIISYLFHYKIREVEDKIYMCGFPQSSMKKITATLENRKIDYLVLDRRNNYEVDEKSSNGNLNQYQAIYEKAKSGIMINLRIQKIYQELISMGEEVKIFSILDNMEKILNEARKV